MPSTLSWLDFSESDRRKALDIIDLFREREARDELGIGTVRDALSDVLFPGISTIQTRARYFFFIPWLYQSLERKRGAAEDIERLARRAETRLIDALAESADTDGIIGIDARESLKRLPSSVYWQGLHTWGLRVQALAQADYHRFFGRFSFRNVARSEFPEGEVGGAGGRAFWHEGLPEAPGDFPESASFALRREEAQYLRERLLARQAGTLLAWLADRSTAPVECDFPWEHPQREAFTERNRLELEHARRFSLVIHGAALLYNLRLAELSAQESLIDRYREELDAWSASMAGNSQALVAWDRAGFWRLVRGINPRVSVPTQSFIDTWCDMAIGAPDARVLRDRADARRLVEEREKRLKGPQSRIANPAARRLWGGESAAAAPGFRWFQTQRIVNDIVRGLGRA